MVNCGIFKSDLIEIAIEKIGARFTHIDDLTCMNALDDGRILSLEEKKKLGLPSRKKYSEGFIAFINLTNLHGRYPNDIYSGVFMAAWFRIKREMALAKMKALGRCKSVDVLVSDDCLAIKGMPKRYGIDDVPELPLPNCTVDCCRCSYILGEIDFGRTA
jgi:hypothetical protein